MKNRYLFRGKTISGNWVQGLLASKDDKWYISNKAGAPFAYEIRPESICQCTGLKDKNGKLIWENDVVRCKYGTAIVKWDRTEWRIKWIEETIWRRDLHYWSIEDAEGVNVVGNIFDNPELLEV